MNVFCPLRMYSSPSRLTWVFIPPKASEPESGSVIAHAAIFSIVTSGGSQRSFWASVPRAMIVAAPSPRLTPIAATVPRLTPASSLIMIAAIDACSPSPPSMPGPRPSDLPSCWRARSPSSMFLTASAANTSSPNSLNSFRMIGYGSISPLSSASTCGRSSLSMNSRTASRISRSLSDHSNIWHSLSARQPRGDVVDQPQPVGLDGLHVVPAGQPRNRTALNGIHPAGDRALLGCEVGDERRDVRRAEQVEFAILRFGHQRAHPGCGEGETGPGDWGDRVDAHPVPLEFLRGDQRQRGDRGFGRTVVRLTGIGN